MRRLGIERSRGSRSPTATSAVTLAVLSLVLLVSHATAKSKCLYFIFFTICDKAPILVTV